MTNGGIHDYERGTLLIFADARRSPFTTPITPDSQPSSMTCSPKTIPFRTARRSLQRHIADAGIRRFVACAQRALPRDGPPTLRRARCLVARLARMERARGTTKFPVKIALRFAQAEHRTLRTASPASPGTLTIPTHAPRRTSNSTASQRTPFHRSFRQAGGALRPIRRAAPTHSAAETAGAASRSRASQGAHAQPFRAVLHAHPRVSVD